MLLYFHQMLVLLENQMCSSGHYPPVCFLHREFEHLLKAASTALAAAPATPCRDSLGTESTPPAFFPSVSLTSFGFVSGISTSGALGPGSTTASTTPRMATSSTGRPTTTSALGRRNRSTSTPSPMADVPDEMTTHLPPASSQLPPAGAESCDPMEARDIMWSRTRQGQMAKQPCPMGSIGKSRGGLTTGPCGRHVFISGLRHSPLSGLYCLGEVWQTAGLAEASMC